jgi:threonine/homoserine/homoserine lactone efflux protein
MKGLFIDFFIAAPVGPIGVLTIKHTLSVGCISCFLSRMWTDMAHTFYAVVAFFRLTAISSLLLTQEFWMKLVGEMLLIFFAIKSFESKPSPRAADLVSKRFFKTNFE